MNLKDKKPMMAQVSVPVPREQSPRPSDPPE